MAGLLLLRADASPAMGTGHLARCLALAAAWQEAGGEVQLVTCCPVESLLVQARSQGVTVLRPAAPHPDPADLESLLQACREKRPAAVVLDGYHFDHGYQQTARNTLGMGQRLVVIDDYGCLERYCADILVNPNLMEPAAEIEARYQRGEVERVLLGPGYAMLRREFLGLRNAPRRPSGEVPRLLVTMGGSDPAGQAGKVLAGLEPLAGPLAVTLVAGSANPRFGELCRAAARSRHQVRCLRQSDRMAELMREADLVISAAGSTCWELCCLGVPMVLITVAENQAIIARGLARAGPALSLGWHEQVSGQQVGRAVADLLADSGRRQAMADSGRRLVDGQGAHRLARALAGGSAGSGRLGLRPAVAGDCQWIYDWRNHPATRRFAHDPRALSWTEHRTWFRETLGHGRRRLLVAEQDGWPVGVLRFDLLAAEERTALISIHVDPARHGQGLGTATLAAGIAWLEAGRSGWPGVEWLLAEVRSENRASRALFRKLGFDGRDGRLLRPCRGPETERGKGDEP